MKLKDLTTRFEPLAPGHRLCAGCSAPIVVKQVLLGCEYPVVITNATGCLEVSTTPFPWTSWRVPWFHSAFENAAATAAGLESMYKALKKRGKITTEIKFLAIGGDGGTYDIGLQALSGAFERGHDFVYLCYNNEAYMNTGIQRSSATPSWADTTTSPAGKEIKGKQGFRKDLTMIMAAHNSPYIAQASPSHWRDLITKAKKAFEIKGPTFLNVISPCHRGWRTDMKQTIKLAKMAVDTCYWPLFEVENDNYRLNYKPKHKIPLRNWLQMQGRFRHLFTEKNEHLIEKLQREVNERWQKLLELCGERPQSESTS
jgi:pyruvate ferredoxin oxidoreductase beta subunit